MISTCDDAGLPAASFCFNSSRWMVIALSGFFISCATPAVTGPHRRFAVTVPTAAPASIPPAQPPAVAH